jgi:hypothetical protein
LWRRQWNATVSKIASFFVIWAAGVFLHVSLSFLAVHELALPSIRIDTYPIVDMIVILVVMIANMLEADLNRILHNIRVLPFQVITEPAPITIMCVRSKMHEVAPSVQMFAVKFVPMRGTQMITKQFSIIP